jgi:tetratricopeptide (TPR) repeat protein
MKIVKTAVIVFVFFFLSNPIFAQESLQDMVLSIGQQLQNKNIAVIEFSCTNGKSQPASSIIQERIITFFAVNKNVTVVERNKLEAILNEHALQMSGIIDTDSAMQLGKLAAVNVIVAGSFTYITGSEIEVNVRAIDIVTGKIIASSNVMIKRDWQGNDDNINDIPSGIDQKAFENFKRGIEYYNHGKYSMAIEFFNRTIAHNPEYAYAYLYRGIAYYRKGNYDNAMRDYNKAIELNPEYAAAYYNRAIAYKFAIYQYEHANEDLDKAIELNPEIASYYTERGELYVFKKEYDKAMEDLNKAIALNPYEAEAYSWRGYIWYAIKRNNDKAIMDYNKAIEINPASIGYWIDRAEVYFDEKQYSKALNDCNKAIEIDSDHAAEAYVLKDVIIKEMNKKIKKK